MSTFAIPQHPVSTTDKPFDSLGLSAAVLDVVRRIGFEHPTPIQAEVIPVALTGKDVIGLAQTGSGKTAAFVLPLPRDRQTMMFSATMPDSIEMIARDFMRDPVRIDITPEGSAAEGITHRLYLVKESDKRNALLVLLDEELGSTLVFVRRKIDAEWLYHILKQKGHPVTRMHADRSQGKRVQALEGFRAGQHRILVATDIA